MSISALNGWTGGRAAAAEQRVMAGIKNKASVTSQTITGKTVEGSAKASAYTKGFAQKAMSLTINSGMLKKGPFYAKPQ
ncbi:MAG: hypothetical protein HQL82_10235 [Magnetococcales bacterium]|nr:hypothetical protein [Magnetococcales bacterium]